MFTNLYTPTGIHFDVMPVTTYVAPEAFERVLAFAGAALDKRDAVDKRVVNDVRNQTNGIIDSQSAVGGWPVLNSLAPLPDTDRDGMPDYWEATLGLSPLTPGNNNDRDTNGYTDLEEYMNWLAVPHALTLKDTPVDVDLRVIVGGTGFFAFGVTNGSNGTVVLLTNGYTARFTPTNDYSGYASFSFNATNLITSNSFGADPISVFISAVDTATDFGIRIIRTEFVTNSFCITWTSVPGTNYVVQGKPDLNTNTWDVVSPVITATNIETTWCIPLPSVYHFFRVVTAQGTNVPPLLPPQVGSVTATNGGYLFQWSGPTNQQYQVEWTTNIAPPVTWSTVVTPISSVTGQFNFFDDGAQTAPLGPVRFYRLRLYP
jgi:hypothetical protein